MAFNREDYVTVKKEYEAKRAQERAGLLRIDDSFKNIIVTPFGKVAVAIGYDFRREHFYENIKDEDIADIIKIKRTTFRSRISKAEEKLREEFGEEFPF